MVMDVVVDVTVGRILFVCWWYVNSRRFMGIVEGFFLMLKCTASIVAEEAYEWVM